MEIELTDKEFRRLLDMVYIGNWVLNSTRGDERITDYDHLESRIFAQCAKIKDFHSLFEITCDSVIPSRLFVKGGIHEAITDYEDTMFFEILAEELALRDMNHPDINSDNYSELAERIDEYIAEFEENGMDNISLNK